MVNISLENIYYIVMILISITTLIKWIYDLGYKHGKNAKK